MTSVPEELIEQINGVQYLEYTGVGWMKAELLTLETLGRWAFKDARAALPTLLECFHAAPADAKIHRQLIAFFLAEWICYQTPEESCAWWSSEDVSRYQSVSRSTAVGMIDAIIASSIAARKEWLEGEWWPEEKSRMEREYIVDYTKLADVFMNQLFSSSQSCYYALTSPKKQKNRVSWLSRIFGRQTAVKTHQAGPATHTLIGLNNVAIAMFWSFY